ncbi:GTPase HflX, partial [Thermus scotoductus]
MEKIFGKTEGLKKSELKRLSNLYRRRIPKERVLTPELAQVLAGLSQEVGRPISLHLAFLSPPKALEEDWRLLPPKPYFQYLEFDHRAEVEALEEELARQARVRELVDGSGERAILVGVD